MYDFIIIGAGPAGLSAASELHGGGAKIRVIDRKKEVGNPLQCGETMRLSDSKKLGMERGPWIDRVLPGYRLVMPNGKYVLAKDRMVILTRRIFERHIASTIPENKLAMSSALTGIKQVNGGYRIFTTSGYFDSKYIIGADGPMSTVGEYISAYEHRSFVISTINRVKRPKSSQSEHELIIFSSIYPEGYAYVFPRSDGTDNAGVAVKLGTASVSGMNRKFLEKYGYENVLYSGGGLIPLNFRMRNYQKDGILLVGDAAGLTNSVDYGGIYPAISSGRLAASLGLEALSSEMDVLKRYDMLISKEPYFQRNPEKEHDAVYSAGDDLLNLVGELAGGRAIEDIGTMEAISFLIRKRALRYTLPMLSLKKYAMNRL